MSTICFTVASLSQALTLPTERESEKFLPTECSVVYLRRRTQISYELSLSACDVDRLITEVSSNSSNPRFRQSNRLQCSQPILDEYARGADTLQRSTSSAALLPR